MTGKTSHRPRADKRRVLVGTRVEGRAATAQRLLEQETLDVEHIARRTGFGAPEALRHHFSRQLGTTPSAYRQKFNHRLNLA